MSELRRNTILELLKVSGRSSYADLAVELEVSEETVRRDIKRLVTEGVVESVRGGVALPDVLREAAFHHCLTEQVDEKKAIARAGASFVNNGDAIMIGGGSTTSYFSLALKHHRDLTVVTNSVDIARILVTQGGNRVHTIGGELNELSGTSMGLMAVENIQRFAVDKAFFSVGWLNEREGLMCDTLDEVACWQAMISCAERSIALVDSSKFYKRGLFKCASFEEIDSLVTETAPTLEIRRRLQEANCQLICADECIDSDATGQDDLRQRRAS